MIKQKIKKKIINVLKLLVLKMNIKIIFIL